MSVCSDCDNRLILCLLQTLQDRGYLNGGTQDLSNYYNKSQVDGMISALGQSIAQGLLRKVNVDQEYLDPFFVKTLSYAKIVGAPVPIQFQVQGNNVGTPGGLASVNFTGSVSHTLSPNGALLLNISGGGFYQEIQFSNVTDQTWTHTAGRFPNTSIVVGGESVDVDITYPTSTQVRMRSNTPLTGTLILT